jgi:hypothetical protein
MSSWVKTSAAKCSSMNEIPQKVSVDMLHILYLISELLGFYQNYINIIRKSKAEYNADDVIDQRPVP